MTFRVLFVCTGNICRSPLAERLLVARLGEAAGAFEVASAGVNGMDAWEMDELAAAELRRLGGDPSGFWSRRLGEADVIGADLVLTAERSHRSAVLGLAPAALRRAFTIREFAHLAERIGLVGSLQDTVRELAQRRGEATLGDYDVGDPFRRTAEEHRAAADSIGFALWPIADLLAAGWRQERG